MKNDELLKLLPMLNAEQVKIITAWAAHYQAEQKVEDASAALVLQLINDLLGLRVRLENVRRPWAQNAANLTGFVDEYFPGLREQGRYAMCRMILNLLVDDLRTKKVQVRFGTIWIHLTGLRINEVFEQAFPGYRASGLAVMVAKAMGASNASKTGKTTKG